MCMNTYRNLGLALNYVQVRLFTLDYISPRLISDEVKLNLKSGKRKRLRRLKVHHDGSKPANIFKW